MRPVGRPQEHNAFRQQVKISLTDIQGNLLYDCYLEHCKMRNISITDPDFSVTAYVRTIIIVPFLAGKRPIEYKQMVDKEKKHLQSTKRTFKW